MMKDTDFVAKLKDVAKNYKTLYVMGCFGAPMTASNKTRYTQNHEYNRQPARTAMINAASTDTFGFDCVCLIKGILWGWAGRKDRVYGGATYASNGVPDIGADTMITKCSGVSTNFSNIVPGEAVWMEGHIGVYIGDGLAVECTPKWENKVQITAVGNIGKKSGYNTRTWTKHGKLPYVEYTAKQESKPVESSEKTFTPVKGIDVSKWQGKIDWAKVKAAGIKFAMIRLGYGSSDGKSCGVDGCFEQHVRNAVAAGVDIGCYFYSYATSVAAAEKEAEYVVSVLKKYKGTFTYPVAFDLEDGTQQGLGKKVLTDMVIAFGDKIEKSGFYASLYSNLNWLTNYLDDSRLTRFDHWVAQWSSACTYKGAYGMWQSSSTGSVSGISGNVDTDTAYKDYPTVIRSNKLNGFTSATQKPTCPDAPAPVVDPTPSKPVTPTLKFAKGATVNFAGGNHYSSSNGTSGSAVKASKAKITDVYPTGKHPYHCRAVDNSGNFIAGVYGWVDESTLSAIQTTPTPAPKPTTPTTSFKKGDLVTITGSTYYGGQPVPAWVKAKKWIVIEASGDRIVVDKSEDGLSSICSPFKASALKLASASTKPAWTPDVGDIVNYNGNVHYLSANATSGSKCSGGKAKITDIYMLGKSKHPYHLVRVSGSGATVYGWVDANTFTKA